MDNNPNINPYGGQPEAPKPGYPQSGTQPQAGSQNYDSTYTYNAGGTQPTSSFNAAASSEPKTYAPPTGAPVETVPPVAQPAPEPAYVYSTPMHSAAGGYNPPTQPHKSSSGGKTFLIAFAGALVACILFLGVSLGLGLFNQGSSSTVNLGAAQSTSVDAGDVEASLAEAVANKCLPSVVSIDVYGTQSSSGNSIYDFLYGYNNNDTGELTQVSLGSGVILSDDGYIITNNHVVESGQKYKVTIEGESYEADLIGTDSSSDVAILKVKDGSDFKAIELGDSDNIKIGEWVMSIGSPFGLEQSVATGIVSATSRSQIMDSSTDMFGNSTGSPTIYPNMIQTDAAINPGNSGGALVNANGELIGINTLITSYSGNYSGVGFAIPSNYAISLAQSIIAGEEPTHAQLGITMTTINSSIAKRYGFTTDEGAYVSSVASGSAADKAGLEVGDIIVAFDGEKVSSASDVMLDVRTKNPGDTVTVTVVRDGEKLDLQATLGQAQQTSEAQPQNNQQNQNNGGNPLNLFGR